MPAFRPLHRSKVSSQQMLKNRVSKSGRYWSSSDVISEKAFGVGGVDGMMRHPLPPKVMGRQVVLKLTQMLVLVALKQIVQMPEAGKGGDQFDKAFTAITVKRPDFLGGQRLLALIDLPVFFKIKAMFDIQLDGVDFIKRAGIGQLHQRFERWDASAGYVVVQAAMNKLRTVVNFKERKVFPLHQKLR